ncbi:MAG: DUF4381 domain-containing protein [Gammaproteobacteria bacterium]|nr:DUF4381 domain-containing protein [Gammaproteobacteria bacterium]
MAADPLASLKDIHLPSPIKAWPPAPGWMVLACVLLTCLLYIAYRVRRYHRETRPKREALRLLERYHQDYVNDGQLAETCTLINALLKRVALLYYPREQVAELHGQAWIEFLNQTGKKIDFSPVAFYLTVALYQRTMTSMSSPVSTSSRAQRGTSPQVAPCQQVEIPRCARDDVLARDGVFDLITLTKTWIKQQRGAPCST